jgi:hypothetical protein
MASMFSSSTLSGTSIQGKVESSDGYVASDSQNLQTATASPTNLNSPILSPKSSQRRADKLLNAYLEKTTRLTLSQRTNKLWHQLRIGIFTGTSVVTIYRQLSAFEQERKQIFTNSEMLQQFQDMCGILGIKYNAANVAKSNENGGIEQKQYTSGQLKSMNVDTIRSMYAKVFKYADDDMRRDIINQTKKSRLMDALLKRQEINISHDAEGLISCLRNMWYSPDKFKGNAFTEVGVRNESQVTAKLLNNTFTVNDNLNCRNWFDAQVCKCRKSHSDLRSRFIKLECKVVKLEEVGMIRKSSRNPQIQSNVAVSPDGIVVIEHKLHVERDVSQSQSQSIQSRERSVLQPAVHTNLTIASLEVKTASSQSTIDSCKKSAKEYGSFNTFYITKELFHDSNSSNHKNKCRTSLRALVETNHLCQCLHQAYTLDLQHVLYVKASEKGMLYTVLLRFDSQVLQLHEAALQGVISHILNSPMKGLLCQSSLEQMSLVEQSSISSPSTVTSGSSAFNFSTSSSSPSSSSSSSSSSKSKYKFPSPAQMGVDGQKYEAMCQSAHVTRAAVKALEDTKESVDFGCKTLLPKPIALWNRLKTFVDQLARDHDNNMIGATKISPPTMLMYQMFVMLLRQCWKLAGICQVDIDVMKSMQFPLEYYRTILKRHMTFKEFLKLAVGVFTDMGNSASDQNVQCVGQESNCSTPSESQQHAIPECTSLSQWNSADMTKRRLSGDHKPVHVPSTVSYAKRCMICSGKKDTRRTTDKCNECNVPLHPGKCFDIFHSDEVLVKRTRQEMEAQPVAVSNTKGTVPIGTKNTANKKQRIDVSTSVAVSNTKGKVSTGTKNIAKKQ